MLEYLERMRVRSRSDSGSVDPDTGDWTPAASATLYDGAADVQDLGEEIATTADGQPVRSDATAFLTEAWFNEVEGFETGNVVEVLWNPGDLDMTTFDWDAPPAGADITQAEVLKVVRLDYALELRYLA